MHLVCLLFGHGNNFSCLGVHPSRRLVDDLAVPSSMVYMLCVVARPPKRTQVLTFSDQRRVGSSPSRVSCIFKQQAI